MNSQDPCCSWLRAPGPREVEEALMRRVAASTKYSSSTTMVVGTFPLVSTVPDTSGKVSTLSPVGGTTSKAVLTDRPSGKSSLWSEKTSGYRPERTAKMESLVPWSSFPSVIRLPSILVLPSRFSSSTTLMFSTMSGRFPVVTTVPDTSGKKRMLEADGSSTASERVRRSIDLPSKRSGTLPPIADLISMLILDSGIPRFVSFSWNLALPWKIVSPVKVEDSITSGRFPVVTTVPTASGKRRF
mmetsp:Transcript_14491/g.22496  ORF Transcript_14491/g.22496 Transcript_14491/m.22496 type:complete len:243 (-) Transcript_14491:19-747(-)